MIGDDARIAPMMGQGETSQQGPDSSTCKLIRRSVALGAASACEPSGRQHVWGMPGLLHHGCVLLLVASHANLVLSLVASL